MSSMGYLLSVLDSTNKQQEQLQQALQLQQSLLKEILQSKSNVLLENVAGVTRPGSFGVMGMFTYDFRDQVNTIYHYKNCTFRMDIDGVIKKGEVASKVRVYIDNKMEIEHNGKLYKMNLGFYCSDVTSTNL